MAQRTIKGSLELGESIKNRRQTLGLTIEEAAKKAGVGIKSWCRYETGSSIRSDKAKGICKALNWNTLLNDNDVDSSEFYLEEYKHHKAWSKYLSDEFGDAAAISFIIGSDLILDYLSEDINELSKLPAGTHIGQLPASMMKDILPVQFLMQYNYEFLYQLKATVINLRAYAHAGNSIIANSVLQELAMYLFKEESTFLMESMANEMTQKNIGGLASWEDWCFDLFDDMDIVTFLYSNTYLPNDHPYHFAHWHENQFYV